MSMLRLSNEQMVQFGDDLLVPSSAHHQTIAAVPTAASYLPLLADALAQLRGSQQEPTDPRYVALTAVCTGLDGTHDDHVRGIDHVLQGFALLTPDADLKAQLERLRALLFPTGTDVVNLAWSEEAGAAKMREERLKPADRKLLDKLPVPGGKMSGVVETMDSTAKLLGEKVNERKTFETETNGTERRAARNAWVRAINGIDKGLADGGVSAVVRREVLSAIREAEIVVDRAAAARPKKVKKPAAKKSAKGAGAATPVLPAGEAPAGALPATTA